MTELEAFKKLAHVRNLYWDSQKNLLTGHWNTQVSIAAHYTNLCTKYHALYQRVLLESEGNVRQRYRRVRQESV